MRRFITSAMLTLAVLNSFSISNNLGTWLTDEYALPAYHYTGALPFKATTPKGNPVKLPSDPWFLLGNYRLTMFTHVSGIYQLVTGERAWARLNQASKNYADNGAYIECTDAESTKTDTFALVGMKSEARNPQTQKVFGVGFASYAYSLPNGVSCKRVLSVLPSDSINEGISAFVVTVSVVNSTKQTKRFNYTEYVLSNYEMAQEQAKAANRKIVWYSDNVEANDNYQIIKSDFSLKSSDPTVFKTASEANKYDVSPPSLFVKFANVISGNVIGKVFSRAAENNKNQLQAQAMFELAAGQSACFNIIIGYSYDNSFEAVEIMCNKLLAKSQVSKTKTGFQSGALYGAKWKSKLPQFANEPDATLRREMIWDAYVLDAMATYNAYFNETYIPQGTVYDYEFGTPAAVRDHLQHMLPLCYYNPQLAKSCLRFCLKKMTLSGELRYTDYGYGMTSNLCFNTSDQQLYLFQSIAEYLRITGDIDFLIDKTNYQPLEAGISGTTIEKIQSAYIYYRDEVALGPKGLPRILNSDWNDAFFFLKSSTIYYATAESHMNAVMTMKIFADLLPILSKASNLPRFAQQQPLLNNLSIALEQYRAKVSTAYMADFGNRSFSTRCYLNENLPQGDTEMYLEPQSFLLQLPEISIERKNEIYNQVQNRILKNELLGARQMEVPLTEFPIPHGSRENGGFWFALQGPFILGVATYNKPLAQSLLKNMTFQHFSEKYPNYWAGQWTQTDALYSSLRDQEGLADEAFCADFPAFCAHPHAWPLYCYLKINETK